MTSAAISVENLSKAYRIGLKERMPDSLAEAMTACLKAPFRRWRQLRRLNTFGQDVNSHSSLVTSQMTDTNGKVGFNGHSTNPKSQIPNSKLDSDDLIWALRDVSFEVQEGEVLGVIGRNGAGKSTLLKILSRITEPTRGRAVIRGRVSSLLEVGTGFHPELTGRENVYMNGTILGMTKREIDRKFDEIVDFSGVEKFLDTPIKRYSSGMKVRLAFSVAAHLEPEILIVDEVLAVGDGEFQAKCLGKMQDVSASGRTVLFVSHNMSVIQQLCTRAILLEAGLVSKDGAPRDVLLSYFSHADHQPFVSLRDWPDRVTNGEGRIVELRLTDGHGVALDTIPVNGSVQITIVAELATPVRNPYFGVLVHTSTGEPLLDLQSKHSTFRMGKVEGRVEVQATIDQLGLYPGRYLLSPWIENRSSKTTIDWVMYGAQLHVQSTVDRNGGPKLDPAFGKYFVRSKWRTEREMVGVG